MERAVHGGPRRAYRPLGDRCPRGAPALTKHPAPPVRFGLVGAGRIAQSYAEAFEGLPRASIRAVCDLRPDAAQALAERLGCTAYASFEVMATAVPLDAVVVCTPPVTHPEISVFFLERGIHVLCEKPLAIDRKSAWTMIQAAERTGVTLTMASKFRYVGDVIRARSVLVSGILGDIVLFENTFTARVDMSSRWNSNAAISGGGVLIDNGTHAVDLIRYFLGPIAEVQVVEGRRSQPLQVEDTVRVFVRCANGVIGSVDLSWSIDKEVDSYIKIYGSHGTVSVGWRESKYRQSSSPDWVRFGSGYDKVQAFRRQLENFARSIRGQEPLLITSDDALASVDVIEAAYESLRENHWRPVTPSSEEAWSRQELGAGLLAERP